MARASGLLLEFSDVFILKHKKDHLSVIQILKEKDANFEIMIN